MIEGVDYHVVYKKPLIWPVLKFFFPEIDFEKGTVVTICGRIYTCWELHPECLRHELVHVRQQGTNWFYVYLYFIPRYILDVKFRLRMESEAHDTNKHGVVK